MSKRPLPTALGEADVEKNPRPSKQTVLDDDAKTELLLEKLSSVIFKGRPTSAQSYAIDYLANMRLSPAPNMSSFVSYSLTKSPNMQLSTLSNVWCQLKEYFSSGDAAIYEALQDLMDVQSVIDDFRNAPALETEPTVSADQSQPGVSAQKTSQRSRSGSTGSSNSNNLSLVAIIKMKEEFGKHFDAFRGESWKLESGTVVDQVIAAHVTTLSYESTLHSFIIENPNVILELFSVEADKNELKKVLMERPGEEMAKLSTEELRYLGLYDKPPLEVDKLLAGGWANMPTSTEGPTLDDEFRKITHCCLQFIHLIYSQGNFSLPRDQAESWFMDKLWGFLNVVFDSEERLEHQPGEVSSQASALRRSRLRTPDERQLPGRKTDGLVSSAVTRLELCTIEAAKKDNGASSTKALSDTRKMAKNMKDMNDLVRTKSKESLRERLATYGIRISAGTITFYSLRQRPGRFYQLCMESNISFPAVWSSSTTKTILSVVASVLAFRRELSQTADQITEATSIPLDALSTNSGDIWAATLTTPTNSPRLSPRVPTDV